MDYIGKYVKQFESGPKGSLALGSCGNDWGLSCGSYQLTLRWGNCIEFLQEFFPNESTKLYFSNRKDKNTSSWPGPFYCSNPEDVKKIWIQCYNKVGAEKFFEYEHQYMEKNYYSYIKEKVKNYINLDIAPRAFQECFWSWSIHRGVNGAYKEFIDAIKNCDIKRLTKEELFNILYDKRYKTFPDARYNKAIPTSEVAILKPLLYQKSFYNKEGGNGMKYSNTNKPLVCMMTNSTCYKSTRQMQVKGILWHSTGANNPNLKRYVQPSPNDNRYNELISLIGKNNSGNDWNHISHQAGVNAWIGKLANGTVATVQTMPWDYRPWGCGSGIKGSCNNGWIQFEICEDGLTDINYFNQIYKEACELTAYLCKMYNINPYGTAELNGLKIPTILCHSDSYKLGVGGNHADVLHWFPKFGKNMDTVRNDVAKLIEDIIIPTEEEEEDMTQERFNELMNNWIIEQSKKAPGDWSAEQRIWAEKNGLIAGDTTGNKMYKKFLTREEFITVLYRAFHRNIVE